MDEELIPQEPEQAAVEPQAPTLLSQEEVDTEAHAFVMGAVKHYKNQRLIAGYEDEWNAAENSYFNATQSFYQGISKVRVPALHNAVETIVPIIDKATFPPDGQFFDVIPDDDKNQVLTEEAARAKALLSDQFRDMNLRCKLIGPTRNLCVYGTLIVKTRWEHKVKSRYKRNAMGERELVWETVFDNPDFSEVSIRDFYVDIKDEDMEGFVAERIVKNYQELLDSQDVFRNVEKLKEVKYTAENDPEKRQADINKNLNNHIYGSHEHKVEVFEGWGSIPKYFLTLDPADKEAGTYVDGFIVTTSAGVVLKIDDNPYDHQEKPYIRCRYIKVSGRFYGLGVMTVNIPLEAELNTRRQQTLDMQTKNLRPKWVVDTNAEIDENQLRDEDEIVIKSATGVAGIQPIRPNDMTASSIAAEQNTKQDIADGTGSKPVMSGTPNNANIDRTAVGVTSVVQGALSRIDLAGVNYDSELLKQLARHVWMLDQQYLDQPREVMISGMGLIKVNPRDIPLPKINFIGIKELGEKQFKINSLNILVQNLAPFAPMGLDPVPVILEEIRLMGLGYLIPQIDKRPDAQQETPEAAVQDLLLGRVPRFNVNDDHAGYIAAYEQLLANPELPGSVRNAAEEALGQRKLIIELLANWDGFSSLVAGQQEEDGAAPEAPVAE